MVLSFNSGVSCLHARAAAANADSPCGVVGTVLSFRGQRHPIPGVWYSRKLSASPTLDLHSTELEAGGTQSGTYLTTLPLIHRFCLNMFVLMNSTLGIRRKYLRYTATLRYVDTAPTTKADAMSVLRGVAWILADSASYE